MLSLEKRKAARAHERAVASGEVKDPVISNGVPDPVGDTGVSDANDGTEPGPIDPIDGMTVDALDTYIKARNAVPVGNKADKVTLAKSLPVEIPSSGWGG